eukprot:2416368-Rhodomonas_salina.1
MEPIRKNEVFSDFHVLPPWERDIDQRDMQVAPPPPHPPPQHPVPQDAGCGNGALPQPGAGGQ